MSETIDGEFKVYQEYRDAGIGYLDLMRECSASPIDLVNARNRFMSARTDWAMKTVQVTVTPL